jgi:hypothetical protein
MNKNSSGSADMDRIRVATRKALEIFGESSSVALIFHLKSKYGINIEGDFSLAGLDAALSDLLGSGAQVILNTIRQQLA